MNSNDIEKKEVDNKWESENYSWGGKDSNCVTELYRKVYMLAY
jgi:hypothetical protein